MRNLSRPLMLASLLLGSVSLSAVVEAAEGLATVKVTRETVPQERWFDGTVQAVRQSTVSAETSGRVQTLLADVGDTVPAGAVIIKLVSNEQQQGYNQAMAALDEARSAFEVANRDNTRAQELAGRQMIAKADVDRVAGIFSAAKARVASAEAALKAAGERLSYTEVRAPYGGVVSERLVEIGEAVRPGTPLMSGFDPRALRVQTEVPQAVATLVEQAHKARVVSDAGEEYIPEKLLVFPQADQATSTVRLRLELPRQQSTLHPGQFVKVAVTVGDAERLLLPRSAVVQRSGATAVYVVDGQQVTLRQLRLGEVFGERVEVISGLRDGEQVALDPVAAGTAAALATGRQQ